MCLCLWCAPHGLRLQAKIDSAACHAALKRSPSSASASALKAQVWSPCAENSVNSVNSVPPKVEGPKCHARFSSAGSSSDRAAQGAQGNHGRTARRGIASGAALHSCAVLSKISCALRRGDDSTRHSTALHIQSPLRMFIRSALPSEPPHRVCQAVPGAPHSALCLPTDVLLRALVVRVELGLALCEMQEAAARRHTRMGTEL